MSYFDPSTVAREAGIPDETLSMLEQMMRQEYPGDPMMADLQLLRVCLVIRDGLAGAEEILRDAHRPEPYSVRCASPTCSKCDEDQISRG